LSITNFSLPPKPEEDVQENRNDYSSFAPASEHLHKSPSLKKVALVVDQEVNHPEKRCPHPEERCPRRSKKCYSLVDREVNPPEKRCPHPEERRPRRSKKGCPGG